MTCHIMFPNVFSLTVDMSHLVRGLQYRICVDVDGQTPVEAFGDAGFKIYSAGMVSCVSA